MSKSSAVNESRNPTRVNAHRSLLSEHATTWKQIRETTLAAHAALIARREQTVALIRITAEPVELPDRPLLSVTTRPAPIRGWSGRDFFVIDSDTKDAREPIRHRVELAYEPKATRLVLRITPSIRRALGTATHVHIAYADDFDLEMMRSLQAQLTTNASRGPRVEDMWSGGGVLEPSAVQEGLNAEQSRALAAMTTGGGWLVWGPPGTGKTKVIVQAVNNALSSGRSVLIASHTHVAVDNVVKDLRRLVTEPGQVIRVGSEQKVDGEVVAHDWLLLEKAAAAKTRRIERLAYLRSRQRANRDHPDRGRLEVVQNSLQEAGIGLIERAFDTIAARRELNDLVAAAAAADQHRASHAADYRHLQQRIEEQRQIASQRPLLEHQASVASQTEVGSANLLVRTRAQLQETRLAYADAVTDRHRAQTAMHSLSAKLPWKRNRVADWLTQATRDVDELDSAAARLEQSLPSLTDVAQEAHNSAERARQAVAAARTAEEVVGRLTARLRELEGSLVVADTKAERLRGEIHTASAKVGRVADPEAVLAQAEAAGVLTLRDEREQLIESVAELDDQHRDLDQEQAKLDDEYKDTLRTLLENSPVIACTLSALTTKAELANRRFGIVIVDEAASASIPQLIYAGSKADYGLAFVGDFLQNAPITDPGDAVTAEQHVLLPWQQDDIFGLLGIRDRASAQAHPRCVALRTQYRYPSTIADIVNDFCYDGLLESSRHAQPADGTIVTFVDTSAHRRRGLRRDGKSWVHDLGLEILTSLSQESNDGHTIGLVCPYKAHADQAAKIARMRHLPVQCGTSHSFQGRQFETVIVDLMQDDQRPRWIAAADIHGDQRATSAAKLLNVAITRAQRRLYLIGDWPFITRTDTPGMRALAALRTNAHFEVVPAAAYSDDG